MSQREPIISEFFDFVSNLNPLFAFVGIEQFGDVVSIGVVDLLDASVSEREFAHPLDSAAHARRQGHARVGRVVEAVRGEVVRAQVLSIIVRCHVVNMHLITFLLQIENKYKFRFSNRKKKHLI